MLVIALSKSLCRPEAWPTANLKNKHNADWCFMNCTEVGERNIAVGKRKYGY
jgi:hypothetical protein